MEVGMQSSWGHHQQDDLKEFDFGRQVKKQKIDDYIDNEVSKIRPIVDLLVATMGEDKAIKVLERLIEYIKNERQ